VYIWHCLQGKSRTGIDEYVARQILFPLDVVYWPN